MAAGRTIGAVINVSLHDVRAGAERRLGLGDLGQIRRPGVSQPLV
jgi:hypothetical protein